MRAVTLVLALAGCGPVAGPVHDLAVTGAGAGAVTPLVDGAETTAALAQVIRGAQRFVALAMWSFDERTRLSAVTQFPPRADEAMEVPCADQREDDTLRVVLRCQAARMAERLAAQERAAGGDGLDARAEVRVMLWANPLDFSDFAAPLNAAGRLGVVRVPWAAARKWSDERAVTEMRALGSGESARWLAHFHARYRQLRNYDGPVVYPTGIYVVSQSDPGHITSSEHLKTVQTEREALVGGINLVRESWDVPTHALRSPLRMHSGVAAMLNVLPGTATPFEWPMHDTAVRISGPALHGVTAVLNARWSAAMHDVLPGWGRHPYGPLLQRLRQMQRRATGADLEALRQLEGEVLGRERALPRPAAPVSDETAPPGGTRSRVEAAAFSGFAPSPSGVGDLRKYYQRAVAEARGGVALIENQYVSDVEFARAVAAGAEQHGLETIVLIPYLPDMLRFKPLDESVRWLGWAGLEGHAARDEMRTLRWLELRTARAVLTRDDAGHWVRRGSLEVPPGCAVPHLRGADDPATLAPDDPLDISVALPASDACPPLHPLGPLRVRDVLTESHVHVFTLAADDGLAPDGETPTARVAAFFHATRSGIYIHSKAAMFLDESRGFRLATVGSANLNHRSLGPGARAPAGPYDSELNVFFDGEAALRWAVRLADEHTRGRVAALPPSAWPAAFETWGGENLRALQDGIWPGPNRTRVVRLDVVERCVELGGC